MEQRILKAKNILYTSKKLYNFATLCQRVCTFLYVETIILLYNTIYTHMYMDNNDNNNILDVQDFGQKADLCVRIREILRNYPEGSSILKELIQNADDAGATTVRIMLDETQYGTESLLGPTLAPLQGASLLVFNDAIFSDIFNEVYSNI